MRLILLISLSLITLFSFGQNLNIDGIYNFSPSKLSQSEQEKKLPAIDALWNSVKADTLKKLPLLRNELNAPNHNPFFYYDGAVLLLSLSKTVNDKTIAANSIANCDLSDIDRKEFVKTLNRLSNDGINVTKAAIKILNDTSFSFFLVQHAMYFRQEDCLAYMLLPQKTEYYIDTLLSLFKSVNPNSQKSILQTMWYAFSCKGDSLIKAAANDKFLSKTVADYAKDMIKSPELGKEIKGQIKSLDRTKRDEMRKESLKRFSDEALDDLMISTLALRAEENCR